MGDRFKYAALGDSSAVGIGALEGGYPARITSRLVATGTKIATINVAQSGGTSDDVLHAQVPAVEKKGPDLITLGIGANDAWQMVPIDRFRANLGAIADRLAATGASILVTNIADLTHAPIAKMAESLLGVPMPLVGARIALFNGEIARLAERPGFKVIDLFAISRAELPDHPEYFCADGFHPSDVGYERWAQLVWPEVEKVLARHRASRDAASR